MFKGKLYPNGGLGSSTDYSQPKTNFLNAQQREDLKKKMLERFNKQFGKKYSEIVQEEIDYFFSSGADVNTPNITILENRIKGKISRTAELVKESNSNQQGEDSGNNYNTQPVVPGNGILQSELVTSSQPELKLPTLGRLSKVQMSAVQNIDFKNEEEKWGTIWKYNNLVYAQEQKMQKMKAAKKVEKMKKELDEQIREKERRRQKELEEQTSFLNLNRKVTDIERQKEENRKELVKQKILFSKDMRQVQMRENEQKRRLKSDLEKQRDELTMQKIKEELAREQQEVVDLRNQKLEEMRRVMQENEERKIIMAQEKENERLENIELQKKAIEISEELERKRAAEFKARSDRISNIMKRYSIVS
jgi:hypothetical protein